MQTPDTLPSTTTNPEPFGTEMMITVNNGSVVGKLACMSGDGPVDANPPPQPPRPTIPYPPEPEPPKFPGQR